MKKKIVCLIAAICLVFPCFFSVACTIQKPDRESKAYTLSIKLKNTEGKIDTNSLLKQWDSSANTSIDWVKSNNDYEISVNRNGSYSNSLKVNLLEGIDYSNLSFKINGEESDKYAIKSGTKTACAKEAHLTDRYFQYSYSNMSKNTELVLDFENCEKSKVEIDVSALKLTDVKYIGVQSEFLTLLQAEPIVFSAIAEDKIEVDYGSIIAFSSQQQLTYSTQSSDGTLQYSTYGSRFLVNNGRRVQYLTVKNDCEIKFYSPELDENNNGTLRVLNYPDVKVTGSYEDLELGTIVESEIETELFDGEWLNFEICKEPEVYIELSGDARNYNYYMVNSIDEKLTEESKLSARVLDDNRDYIFFINDSKLPTKYVYRLPKNTAGYYAVSFERLPEYTTINNFDYVTVGENNKSAGVPKTNTDKIFYYLKTDKQLELTINAFSSDVNTFASLKNTDANVNVKYTKIGESKNINFDFEITNDFVKSFDIYDDVQFYTISVRYSQKTFNESIVNLDITDLELYEGEKIFYSLEDPFVDGVERIWAESWKELTELTNDLSISSRKDSTIYYYFKSTRSDAGLNICNGDEIVSQTNILRDCFDRTFVGTIEIDGEIIDFSNVYYLEIQPGYYSEYTAKLKREYDTKMHTASTNNAPVENIKIATSSDCLQDATLFKDFSSYEKLDITYLGFDGYAMIYYYVDGQFNNKILTLKDSNGEICSKTVAVLKDNANYKINGRFVYCLMLLPGYYAEDEEFSFDVSTISFGVQDNLNNPVEFYRDAQLNTEAESVLVGQTYYFVGDKDSVYFIKDNSGATVAESLVEEANHSATQSVYLININSIEKTYDDGYIFHFVKG